MAETRFSGERVVSASRRAEAGTPVAEVRRKPGSTEQAVYRWRRPFAGMGIAEPRRLRRPEDENRRLKRLAAAPTPGKRVPQEAVRNKR